MVIYKILMCAGWLIALHAFAETKMDKKDSIDGVTVLSGKNASTRIYSGSISKTFPFPLKTVVKSIVNFQEKCNNSYKDRRKFTDKNTDCKYHNDNLVETILVKDIKRTGWTKEHGEVERYLLGRQVYNRGSFGYYELVRVYEGQNANNQKTLKIVQTMMEDKEVKNYTNPSFEKDSAFDHATSTYILTEIGPKETSLDYEYKADTEHWILNKEVSVPQVFSSISKGINDLLKTVDAESNLLCRDLASN
jgi:hypothetical protein